MGLGAEEEATAAADEKFGQVPRLRCSEAVRDGFEAEKMALHSEQRSLTALGSPESEPWTSKGSRLAQYHAPFPFNAFVRTATRASYLLVTALTVASAASADCVVPGEFSPAIDKSFSSLQDSSVTVSPILVKVSLFFPPLSSPAFKASCCPVAAEDVQHPDRPCRQSAVKVGWKSTRPVSVLPPLGCWRENGLQQSS
ncbi:hypothetical protein IEQ34_005937 [Dendrobium chrysotoxum]|uniref:Uncharacterized protein n=1 Tax=Dendrobium chrysotoxum TaxID=161865 RepID=A0AAV7HCQ2_DENCH|nr:hypothetical protein IEQ34_005937 [Dendrobium chrysotoxum]